MNSIHRRRKQQIVFGVLVVIAGVVSLAFFLASVLPARTEYARMEGSIGRMRVEIGDRIRRLEEREAAADRLDRARARRMEFFASRLISREDGFATILLELDEMSRQAGVRRDRVQYQIDPAPRFGAYTVGVEMPVRGDYRSIMRFIHALEDSGTFFILDSIGLSGGRTSGPDEIQLALRLTTFFADAR